MTTLAKNVFQGPLKRRYLGPQGHFGPQMGLIGSAFAACSHLVVKCLPKTASETRKILFFVFSARFRPVLDLTRQA